MLGPQDDGGNAADEEGNGWITLYDPAAATDTYYDFYAIKADTGGARDNAFGGGKHTTAEAMTAIKFYSSTNNTATGFFKLYRRLNA